jgi:hypothetical protein
MNAHLPWRGGARGKRRFFSFYTCTWRKCRCQRKSAFFSVQKVLYGREICLLNRPLAKVFLPQRSQRKKRVKSFSQKSLCALWLNWFYFARGQISILAQSKLTVYSLTASHGSYNPKRLMSHRNCIEQRSVWRFKRQVLPTGEESKEGSALLCDMVTDGSAQHRILDFERVQNQARRRRPFNLKLNFLANLRQSPQVMWKHNAYHCSV